MHKKPGRNCEKGRNYKFILTEKMEVDKILRVNTENVTGKVFGKFRQTERQTDKR